MPITPSAVKRSTDATGDDIKTFDDDLGKKIQAAALVDETGAQVGTDANPLPVTVENALTVSGTVGVSGSVEVANDAGNPLPVNGTVAVSNFPATQPVSAASLPLPTGASTETTLSAIKAKTDNLDVALSTRTKPADTQKVDGSGVTQPVSAASLPLPTGAATETTLGNVKSGVQLGGYGVNDVATPSGTLTYVGMEDKDGVWLVKKIDTTSGVSLTWATNLNNPSVITYATAWSSRASLTYGTYSQAF